MRSALNCIQRWDIEGVSELSESKINEEFFVNEEIFEIIFSNPDPVKNYQLIVGQYSSKVDEVLNSLSSDFIKWISEKKPEKQSIIPVVIITVAKYQSERNLVIDSVVSLLACIFTLQQLANK
jgi:hypothetical protein